MLPETARAPRDHRALREVEGEDPDGQICQEVVHAAAGGQQNAENDVVHRGGEQRVGEVPQVAEQGVLVARADLLGR
jgi:hypothetical protein